MFYDDYITHCCESLNLPSMTEDEQAVILDGGGGVVFGRGGGGEEVVVPAGGEVVERDSVVPGKGELGDWVVLGIGAWVVPVVNITGPVVVMKSSHPGGNLGVQSRGRDLVLVLPVLVRVFFVLPVLPVPVLVLPVSVRVLFVLPVPVLVLPVSVRVLLVRPVLPPGPVLVLPVSVRVLLVRPVLPPGPVLSSSVRVLLVRAVLPVGPVLVLVLLVSVRFVRVPGRSVLVRPRVRVLSIVGHSVTGGQVHS